MVRSLQSSKIIYLINNSGFCQKGTMSEGVYRKAGSSSNIQKLSAALRKDAFSVQITRCEYNEHDVSSALKRFFRELPEPLMGKLAVSFLSVSEMKSQSDKLQAYKELLLRLPSVEYQTLKKLLGHLHFIQTQKDVNKMKAENLALVFGPTLMQPQNNENQYTIDTRDSEVVAELITNYKKLYELTPDEIVSHTFIHFLHAFVVPFNRDLGIHN